MLAYNSRCFFYLLCILMLLGACTQNQRNLSPKEVLQEYVKTAINSNALSDKKKLIEMTTGEARESLSKMSDSAYDEEFIQRKRRLVSFEAKDIRTESSGDLSLIYTIAYDDFGNDQKDRITVRKVAYFTKDEADNKWKIKATKNIKEFIEIKDDRTIN